jgi:adenine-specific DNA methylase
MPYVLEGFPIEEIDELAWRESNVRKPIYHIHRWFARRVGSTFRALILGTFLEDNPMKHYYERVELKNGCGRPPIVLDPFMGGGTTILEGHRLGCRMIGVDINPLSWFITKMELEPVDKQGVEEEFRRIESSVKRRILSLYKTRCKKGHEADTMYVFWVKKLRCENCNREVLMHKNFVLAKPKEKWVYLCPKCGEIFRDTPGLESTKCPTCSLLFNPRLGFSEGRRYLCPNCNFRGEILGAVRRKGGGEPPEHEMFAIEYYCTRCGRDYKKPCAEDFKLYYRARSEFERIRNKLLGFLIPEQGIPDGFSTSQMKKFNYKYWYQMFNERQLYCLSLILREILKIKDDGARDFFLATFSDCLNSNNMFTVYNAPCLKLEPLFGGGYFWPRMAPVEGNVWGTRYGRGTFTSYYRKGLKALEYQQKPYELKFQSHNVRNGAKMGWKKFFVKKDKISGLFASHFEELLGEKNVLLRCDSAVDLSFIPDGAVDAVVTDPPYYDNIMYSELSDFFYVWLRLGLKEKYPEVFGSPLTRREEEIIVNEAQSKGEAFYAWGLTQVFREVFRVLRNEGLLVFVFQYRRTSAWKVLLQALTKSGFRVVAVYPTYGETPSGVRTNRINYDAILVCKKFTENEKIQVDRTVFWEELTNRIDSGMRKALSQHPDLSLEDAFIIGMGKALEVYTQTSGGIIWEGKVVDSSEVPLEAVENIIFESFLSSVVERAPEVDHVSKIYAAIFAKKDKIGRDIISKISNPEKIFEKEKLVKRIKNTGKMAILPPILRMEFVEQKIRNSLPLTYVDAAHLLWTAHKKKEGTTKILETIICTGINGEKLRQYIRFLWKRTRNTTWKEIESELRLVS